MDASGVVDQAVTVRSGDWHRILRLVAFAGVLASCHRSHTHGGAAAMDGSVEARDDAGEDAGDGGDSAPPMPDTSPPVGHDVGPGCEPLAMVEQDRWPRAPLAEFPDRAHVTSTPLVLPPRRAGDRPRLAFVSHGRIVDASFRLNVEAPEFTGRMPVELGGVLRVVDLETGETRSWGDPPRFTTLAPTASLAAGDLDGDGELELVALGAWGHMVAFETDLTRIWMSNAPPPAPPIGSSRRRPLLSVSGAPLVVDLEGDGTREVVFGHCVVEGATGETRFCLDGDALRGSQGYWGPLSQVADLDGDGRLDVVAGSLAFTARGEVLWRHEEEEVQGFAAVRDVLRAHPGPEVVLVAKSRVLFLDARSGRTLAQVHLPGAPSETLFGCPDMENPLPIPVFAGGPPLVADVDGDGAAEVFVANWGQLLRLDPECEGCEIRWSTPILDPMSAVTGISAADLDGDGVAEIVHADEQRLRGIDARDGAVVHQARNFSRTRTEYPVIADLDGDGATEILVSSSSESCYLRPHGTPTAPGLVVFGERHDRWTMADPEWTSHAGPLGLGRFRPTRGAPPRCL